MDLEYLPMRCRRDALDCSLALASQSIPHEIHRADRYYLVVSGADGDLARETVGRFRGENRTPLDRPAFPAPEFRGASSALWCVLLAAFFYLSYRFPGIEDQGILDSQAALEGQWWLVLTATMLHGDLAHLASNLSFGWVLFALAMGRFGIGAGLLGILLCGVGGNLVGLAMHREPYLGLGASGSVMGALGMLAPLAAAWVGRDPRSMRVAASGLCAALMIFALLGFDPDSDIWAHMGGFLTGLALGAVMGRFGTAALQEARCSLACGLAALGLLLLSWHLALGGA